MAVDLDRLKAQLLVSKIQSTNQPLYQVINQLIQNAKDLQAVIGSINGGGGGGGGGGTTINNVYQQFLNLGGDDGGGEGEIGPPGISGIDGPQGIQGPIGPMGAIIFPPDAEDGDIFPPIVGPQGNPGPTGPQGPEGPAIVFINEDVFPDDIPMIGGGSGSSLPTPSLSVVDSALPGGTVDLTADGTLDWIAPNGDTASPRLIPFSDANYHFKATGGILGANLYWIGGGTTSTAITFVSGLPFSCTANDDAGTAALAAATGAQAVQKTVAGTIGQGFGLTFPVSRFKTTTIKIYAVVLSGTMTCDAILPHNSLTGTASLATAAGVAAGRLFTVTALGDGFLNVVVRITVRTATGSNPCWTGFLAITAQ